VYANNKLKVFILSLTFIMKVEFKYFGV